MKSKWVTTAFLLLSGCAMQADEALSDSGANNMDTRVDAAQSKLFVRDLEGARELYTQRLVQDPNDGNAAAGKAVTDVLLLPYSASMTSALKDGLGASRGLNASRDVIYGEGGFLYLLSRGVPFDDGENFPGIATLLEDDLPWTKREMTSATDFVAELTSPFAQFWDRMIVVADDLSVVERNLKTAVDDPEFATYFLPGEIFHDQNLNLVLGKAELSALRTVVGGARAATYFLGAYGWSWSLSDAFGAQWDAVEPDSAEYRDGWIWEDYATDFVSGRALREVAHVERLAKAGTAFAGTARSAAETLRLGQSTPQETLLDWRQADDTFVTELATFLDAVADSVDGRVTLPYTLPTTAMNLSPLFTAPGRVLPEETRWLEHVETQDEFGTYASWQMPDAAVEAFFVAGVMDPEFTWDAAPELTFSGDTFELGERVASEFTNDVEGAYFSGR